MTATAPAHLSSTYLRLRPDARVEQLPVSENFWPELIAGKFGSFHQEYLVSSYSFDANWASWECHPLGDEVVILLSGAVDFVLEQAGGNAVQSLRNSGEFLCVPRNTWHTANVLDPAKVLFITAGEGTEHRPR